MNTLTAKYTQTAFSSASFLSRSLVTKQVGLGSIGPLRRYSTHQHNDRPNVTEVSKKKTETSKKREWSETLASQSEAAVKADRTVERSFDELKRQTENEFKQSGKH